MLKNIPQILTPQLMKILLEMGHGDDIVIGDGNFPAASNAKRLIRMDGHGVPEILDAILKFFPLDDFVEAPVGVIKVVGNENEKPQIWNKFEEIIAKREPAKIEKIERFEFYERTKKAYAVIATSETSLYACVLLKKGVIRE